MPNRRSILALALLVQGLPIALQASTPPSRRPNIVIVLADDKY